MLLDYATYQPPRPRTALALVAACAVPVFGYLTAWCLLHCADVLYAFQHSPGPFFCAEGAQEWIESLGLPLEKTIPGGILCAGITFVAFVHCVRYVNALHRRREEVSYDFKIDDSFSA
ncbi:MAG TPA: hypothetical protein VH518_23195 [Tepidisphaeraceae bacterium]|jgi:TRAP-type C4-dicarboxylate transport system permease small subunit